MAYVAPSTRSNGDTVTPAIWNQDVVDNVLAIYAVVNGAAVSAINALTPAADRLPYFTSGSAAALATLTSFARTLIDDADAATMQATLGVPPNARTITAGTGLTGGGSLASDRTISLTTASQESLFVTGDIKPSFCTTMSGWVLMAGSIGNAASGATTRANADTATLYALLWANLADAEAPVSGGRGANAAADYAANKTLTMPDGRGRALAGKDDMSIGAASRITNAVSGFVGATLGSVGGSQNHTLAVTELPAHTHSGTTSSDGAHTHNYQLPNGSTAASNPTALVTADSFATTPTSSNGAHTHTMTTDNGTGGLGAHRNVQPTVIVNWFVKL